VFPDSSLTMRGNLVADPVQRATANGLKVTSFRIAQSGRRFDRNTQEWVDRDPVYMTVKCWRQLGDNVMQTLRKGDTVLVHGRLTYQEWETDAGRRSSYEVEAWSVGPCLARYIATMSRPVRELPAVAEGEKAAAVPAQPANPWGERPPAAVGAPAADAGAAEPAA
jgi:single-strand DNA-binding protein